jgi:DNA-binding LytR/AlgR family response regulator
MNVRVLAVDDEPLALERLTSLLGQVPDVEIAGAASGGNEAVDAIAALQPDLVILDIEMPKTDGFDVIEMIAREQSGWSAPLIAFATAYPQFALQAFDTGALDFLCKPIRLQRLEKTLERAKRELEYRRGSERLNELRRNLDELRATTAFEQREFWIRYRGEAVRLVPADVDWIEAEGQYVRLHAGERSYLVRHSMSSLVRELSGDGFVQIHRSAVVNRRKIARVKSTRSGVKVELVSSKALPVGRTFRNALRDLGGE